MNKQTIKTKSTDKDGIYHITCFLTNRKWKLLPSRPLKNSSILSWTAGQEEINEKIRLRAGNVTTVVLEEMMQFEINHMKTLTGIIENQGKQVHTEMTEIIRNFIIKSVWSNSPRFMAN